MARTARHSGLGSFVRFLPPLLALALALVWTRPLIGRWDSHILGPPGDNFTFLWDCWWMRLVLRDGLDYFHTAYLFAPSGTHLALHTNLALPALIGATVLGPLSTVLAYNLMLLGTIAANAICAFLFLADLTRDRIAAAFGAVLYAGSGYIAGHLFGHFNLVSAWTLPLAALAATRAATGSVPWAVGAGAIVGLTTYLDYYYTLFAIALAAWCALSAWVAVSASAGPSRWSTRTSSVLMWALVALIAGMLAIVVTGGTDIRLGSTTLVLRGIFNLQQVFWLVAFAWLWQGFQPRLSLSWRMTAAPRILVLTTMAGSAALVAAPMMAALAQQWRSGDYVSQPYNWRSAPPGVDLATVVLGNPFGWLTAEWTGSAYQSLGVDPIEQSAWLGVAPLLLVAHGLLRGRTVVFMTWAAVAGLAGLWALGSHMIVFGIRTGMALPYAALRFIPGLSNARVPGRAMVVVLLAVAAMTALELARRRATSLSNMAQMALFALLIVDLVPRAAPTSATAVPRIYEELARRPEVGNLLEIPFGFRDGFGEEGHLNPATLWYQSVHEKPLIGGFVARLSQRTSNGYAANPWLRRLEAMSAGGLAAAATGVIAVEPRSHLKNLGIRWVSLDREHASAQLSALVEHDFGLRLIASDGPRQLFAVD